ncbi:MAG: exodeoxyribonuclease VII large subunit [Candidatus Promineifilaceae bacterium]
MALPFLSTDYGTQTWQVSELTAYIRELFDIDIRLQDVRVAGEISNFAQARSGHLYFTLKDERAQLRCVMWRTVAERLVVVPSDGDAVIAEGRVSVYEAGGQYQLYVERLEPAGRGDLALAFERLRDHLAAEGLFDQSHKKPIVTIPRKIGIVTSADAAALRDILNVLRRRWPAVRVLVAPTLVQGRDAPPQIVKALQWLDGRNDIDTIIVARGGGSMEDLWAFNDERVGRAIFAARHPVIVGVGHETDFTIADFVADLRAPTPSAAAELAVPDREEMAAYLAGLASSLGTGFMSQVRSRQAMIVGLARSLYHLSPRRGLDSSRQRLDSAMGRLDRTMAWYLERGKSRLALARTGLMAVSPRSTLARGYAIVRRDDGPVVKRVEDVEKGDVLRVEVSDGEFGAVVD